MFIGIEASHANKARRTGVEEYCWQIIQNLKKEIPSDVRVILYSHQPLVGELAVLPSNWSVKILKWPFKKCWSQICLSWEFFRRPPDIFFAPGQLVPLVCPKNTIATIHDSGFMVFPETYGFLSRLYLKWMNRLIIKKAKLILTPSEFSKNELVRLYNFPKEKIIVSPLGCQERFFNAASASAEILKKYGLSKPFIVSVGRIEEKKNFANQIRAFNILRRNFDCQYLLVGQPGRGYEKAKAEIESSPFKPDIIEHGWVDHAELPALLRSAELLLFVSRYEGFGIPVLEAMASGCPVVASRKNSLEEVGGGAAVYAEAENPDEIASVALSLLKNPDLKQEKIRLGLERAKTFSWQKTAGLTWQALKRLSE